MGSLSPLGALGLVQQGIGLVQDFKNSENQIRQQTQSQDLALQQLQKRQQLQQQQTEQQAALNQQELEVNASIDEENRRAALKRAVARQRAQFGSSGVSSAGGSSEAVLLGLFDESEDELTQRERLDAIRSSAIDLGLSQQSASNVLQREQLAQSQRLSNSINSYNSSNNALNLGLGISRIISG